VADDLYTNQVVAPETEPRRRRFQRATTPEQVPETYGLPPGPKRPVLLQSLEWVFDPQRYMERYGKIFGGAFTARLGPGSDVVFLSTPNAVRGVFHGKPEHMNMGDINGLFRRVLGKNSLLVIDGDQHMRQRRLLLPPFHGDRVTEHYASMVAAAEEDVDSFPIGKPFELQPRMQSMTLNVILRAVFGLEAGPRRDKLRVLLARLLELNCTLATTMPQLRVELGGLTPWAKLMRCTKQVDKAVYEEIALRRAEGAGRTDDVLSLLLDARDDDGQPMSDVELRDQLLTMLVAGHETTATALAWAFERVIRHPEGPREDPRGARRQRHVLPRRDDQGDAAAAADRPDHGAQADGPLRDRRQHVPGRHGADALHLPAAPEPGHLLQAGRVHSGALHRPAAAGLRLHPVRRRGAALPRGGLRGRRDARGDGDSSEARRPAPSRASRREDRPPRVHAVAQAWRPRCS